MSRRYPTAELYEERERDFYRNGNRSDRNYDELDIELRRGSDPRRSAPDFFHDDYNRPTAGPMVVRSREDEFARGPRSAHTFNDDTRSLRSARPPPPPSSVREMERDDITIRRSDGPERRRPREVDADETDITIRRREQSRPRQPEFREVERDDIVFRRGDGPPAPRSRDTERDDVRFRGRTGGDGVDFRASHSEVNRNGRDVSAERGSIRFQERDGNFELRANRREFSRDGRDSSRERSSLTIRGRERSLPPPSRNRGDLVAREREEFVIRRPRDASPPSNPREVIRDEIIIRRKEERAPSPSPSPPPPPPPPAPEPEIRPPIIQEIITHHRHIDHGVIRVRTPSPPPPPAPPSPPRNETLEIEINRRESRSRGRGRDFEELDIDINLNRDRGGELEVRQRERSFSPPRRSQTAPVHDSDFDIEAEYYNRKALERGYPGEAWNGATKDWTIVDVPPGTSRVRMDGIGGGAQEITWQRYNGVRRSKFISGDDERATDFSNQIKQKKKDMWTEITKDLVIREAIDSCGYSCEETDDFFYVMEYLRYEDVLHLVEISDDIRRKRKSRIREIEIERKSIHDSRPPPGYDDRFYEHEVSFDSRRSRYR
ncbi:Nn.00g106200.m01.CDS01 [Neocucurbitaria sp. VM-36]